MVLFLLIVIAAMVLGIIGATAEGLGFLLIIGIVLFALDLALAAVRLSRRSHRHALR
ncbi:hypothetical protein ACWC10_32430 [Streptomyces sp. NPDC001595]|uniref:hypothetical protein n=1 Tax=Streptomyces sp. NPDC001532 TaxID=3154520 RepID=UPI0033165634